MKKIVIGFGKILVVLILVVSCNRINKKEKRILDGNTNLGYQVGNNAPDIIFQQCLNEDIDKNFFKNKTIILEFWATWCAPCIAGFPYINQLSKSLSTDDVVFASITRENDIKPVTKLLESKPLLAYNLIDNNNVTSEAFNVNYLPQTFVIGKSGTILWKGHINKLSKQLLKKLIETQMPIDDEQNINTESEITSNYYMHISMSMDQSPVRFGKSLKNTDKYSLSAEKWSFHNLFALQLHGKYMSRVNSNMKDFNIDLEYVCDTSYFKNPKEILIKNLQSIYNFEMTQKRQLSECLILKVTDPIELNKNISNNTRSSSATNDQEVIFVSRSLKEIASNLEYQSGKIVLLDENLNNKKKYDLTIKLDVINDAKKTSAKDLIIGHGLSLHSGKKPVEIMVLDFKH